MSLSCQICRDYPDPDTIFSLAPTKYFLRQPATACRKLSPAPQFKDTDIILQNPPFFRLMIEDSWLLKAEHGPV